MNTHKRKIAGFAGMVVLGLLLGILMPGSVQFNGKAVHADEPPGFDWQITRNDFVRPCQDGPWFVGRTLRFNGSVNNGSSEHIVIHSAAFHSDTAGCSQTTDHGASGFSVSGRTDYPAGSSGTFSFAFNANAHDCGRVQLDAFFATAAGERVSDIFGIVLNYGVDCGGEPTPTPTPPTPTPPTPTPPTPTPPTPTPTAQTPTPTAQTPTPTASTPTPTPTAQTPTPSVTPPPTQPGVLTAQCIGWPNPRVVLNWTSGVNANSNSIQKGDFYPTDPNRFWEFIFQDPTLQVRTFTDLNVSQGQTWSYRVKYSPEVSSNVVTVSITGPNCGATPTPPPPTTITPPPTPGNTNLHINKLVRNITKNSGEADVVNASPNDTVEFSIRVTNVGSVTAHNVRVSDVLPGGMQFVPGSVTIDPSTTSQTSLDPRVGFTVGNLSPGGSVTVRFRAQVDPESSFIVGTTSLTNVAFASATNAPVVSDTAIVTVVRTGPVVIPGNSQLSIQKFGRNITRGETAELTSVVIRANDTIEFIIRVRNVSNVTANNVIVNDVLPSGLTYLPSTTSVNGTLVQDGITTTGGIHIGSLLPNQESVIRFSARVGNISAFPSGSTTAFNTVTARADNAPTVSAQLPLSFGTILRRVAGVKTGTGSTVFTALLLSGMLTLGYAGYTRSALFLRREASAALKRAQNDPAKLNFARFL